jgi:malonyl CoA-acyl carrier protein transacylase
MGRDLFDVFPEQVAIADRVLGYSITELCLDDPRGVINQTEFTQPALFVVSALTFLNHLIRTGELPHIVAGHSLGEYSALFAAAAIDFETGVRLVQRRGQLMAQAGDGGMAVVIGIDVDRIRATLEQEGADSIDIANFNSPLQTVLSGPREDLNRMRLPMERAGAMMFKKLPVSAAFHSRYMADASRRFSDFLDYVDIEAPRIPVVSNVTAAFHEPLAIKTMLSRQITHPVRWVDAVSMMNREPAPTFTELGPGNVLMGLNRRIEMEAARASGH